MKGFVLFVGTSLKSEAAMRVTIAKILPVPEVQLQMTPPWAGLKFAFRKTMRKTIKITNVIIAHILALAASSAFAMVDGTPTPKDSAFAKSSVLILFGEFNRCAGAIIGPRHVITAAHCMNAEPSAYRIAFTTDLTPVLKGEVVVPGRGIARILKHPNYAKVDDLSDDVAILELTGDIPEGFEPAKLPDREFTIDPGARIISLGYGLQNARAKILPMVPPPSGQARWEPIQLAQKEFRVAKPERDPFLGIQLSYHRLLVNQPGGGICLGDSGGPVHLLQDGQSPVLVAVNGATVREFELGPEALPICAANAYVTRVDTVIDWIRSIVH